MAAKGRKSGEDLDEVKKEFLKQLHKGLNINQALAVVGRTRTTYERWRRTDADFVVTGSINKLERHMGAPITALIELEIAVTRYDDGTLLHVGTYSAELPAEGASVDATVSAFNQGLADIFEQFLSDAIQKR